MDRKLDTLGDRVTRLEARDCPPPAQPATSIPTAAIIAPPPEDSAEVLIRPGRLGLWRSMAWIGSLLTALGAAVAWAWKHLGLHISAGVPK